MLNRSISQKVASNTVFNVASLIFNTVIVLLITPYTVYKLGVEQYGVWVLIGVVNAYIVLTDFGIARTLIKFVAEYYAKRDFKRLNEIINTSFCLYVIFAFLGFIILFVLRKIFVTHIFNIPGNLYNEAMFVFVGVAVIYSSNVIFGIFASILNGLQRMDMTNIVMSFSSGLNALSIFLFLRSGFGLKGMIFSAGISSIIAYSANFCLIKRKFEEIKFGFRFFRKKRIREIFKFSLNLQISSILTLLLDPLNKIVISNVLSLNYVSFYQIATRLVGQFVKLFESLSVALFPAISEIDARGDREKLERFYNRCMKYLALLAFPSFCLSVILIGPFVNLWLGSGYDPVIYGFQILLFGWLICIYAQPAFLAALGMGHPRLTTYANVSRAIANPLFCLMLIRVMGYRGLIIGTFIGLLVGALSILILFHRKVEFSYGGLLRAVFSRSLGISCVMGTITFFIVSGIKPGSYFTLAAISIIFMAVYTFVTIKSRWLDSEDKRVLGEILPDKLSKFVLR